MLVLQPVLDEPTPVRLVASGVEGHEVEWTLDGVTVAVTGNREAAVVEMAAGAHTLEARSDENGAWKAMARPDPTHGGTQYVEGWFAEHAAVSFAATMGWQVYGAAGAIGGVGLVLLVWPTRRTKQP